MKNILIPTDFSENAWNAICYGLSLFKDRQCTFFLLNTYTPSIPSSRFVMPMPDMDDLVGAIKNTSEFGLEKTVQRIKACKNNPRHEIKTISSFNLLTDAVCDAVDTHAIDLIITGTKGASGLEEVFMGSNTVRIIKSSKRCPVLAIPHDFGYITPSELAFATDFNRFYTRSELQPLIDLAYTFKARVRIVHVQYEPKDLNEMQQFNLDMLKKYLGEVAYAVHTVNELRSVSKTLDVFAKELDIHLLAMLHYRHGFMEKLTREPIVRRSAFHTQIPLLVIPELGMEGSSRSMAYESGEHSV